MNTDKKSLENENQPSCLGAVSGSISLTANVPKQFAEAVMELHKGYNIELKKYKDYKNGWITVVVRGSRDNLQKLNRECEQIAYRGVL